MITAWRLAAPEFAQTAEELMSGEGARRYGGRWNSPGRAAVYLGDSLALAAMELLVHLQAEDVLRVYRKMPVLIPERLIAHIDEDELPPGWAKPTLHPVVRAIGDRWIDSGQSAVLQVPSATVRGEGNFVVNPEHDDFDDIETGPVSDFRYDARLTARARTA